MYVADGIDALTRRQTWRGRREFDHGRCSVVCAKRLRPITARAAMPLAASGRGTYSGRMDAIRVDNLTKRYGAVLAVDGIDFTVPARRDRRAARRQRRGQDHDDRHAARPLIPSAADQVLGHDMARDRFAALARMNFSSPYVRCRSRLTVAENLRVYGHLYDVPELDGGSRAGGGARSRRSAEPAGRAALRRAEDPRRAGQGADQPAGGAAAGRADGQPGPRHRRPGAPWLERYRAESGCTILLASHNMAEVERLCSDVAMLKQRPHRGSRQPGGLLDPLRAGRPGGGVPGYRARPRPARWPETAGERLPANAEAAA